MTYTGRSLDVETGLYYYRNRYYHAQLGRFVGRDPIGYRGSRWNLYEYCSSRSPSTTDAFGLDCCVPPVTGFPNAHTIKIVSVSRGESGGFRPTTIDDAWAAINELGILDSLITIAETGGTGLTEGLGEAFQEAVNAHIENEISPNGDLVDLARTLLDDIQQGMRGHKGFAMWVEVEYTTCVKAPWYSFCCFREETKTEWHQCRRAAVSGGGHDDVWGGNGGANPDFTLEDLARCSADAKDGVRLRNIVRE